MLKWRGRSAAPVGEDRTRRKKMIETGAKNRILRSKAKEVVVVNEEVRVLIRKMRDIMRSANGIGLAAPQIGVPLRIFVAEVPSRPGSAKKKFYAVVNPELVKLSADRAELQEGCLSLPGIFGPVARPQKITLAGLDQSGKKIKIRAYGLLARVFQHELDHLNGILFIDKARETYRYEEETQR